MTDHHAPALEDRLRDVWAGLLDLTIADGMTHANGARARDLARDLNEIIGAAHDADRARLADAWDDGFNAAASRPALGRARRNPHRGR